MEFQERFTVTVLNKAVSHSTAEVLPTATADI